MRGSRVAPHAPTDEIDGVISHPVCLLAATGRKLVVAYCVSDPLSPPNGERVGVRGKHLKIKAIYRLIRILIVTPFH
jgi:hypothetical protein